MKKITTLLLLVFSFYINAQTNQTVFNDPDFNAGGIGFPNVNLNADKPEVLLVQADSKILIGGAFSLYNNVTVNNIVRINDDGSYDPSFNTGTGFNGRVQSVIYFTPEVIFVGGAFTDYNGTSCNNMILLNLDGSVNSTTVLGTNGPITDAILQTDGKVVFTGSFTTYNSIVCNQIGRLNSDGTLDTSFNCPLTGNSWNTLALHQDGKIIVGGATLYRLNPDGSQDTGFVENLGYSKKIRSIYIDNQDKIYISGTFISNTAINPGQPWLDVVAVFKLNVDGSRDQSFNVYHVTYGNHGDFRPIIHSLLPYQNSILAFGYFGHNDIETVTSYSALLSAEGFTNTQYIYRDSENTFTELTSQADAIFDTAFLADGSIIAIGNFTRGVMKMSLPALGNKSVDSIKNEIISFNSENTLKLLSNNVQIKSVSLYDISGRIVYENQNVNKNEVSIASLTSGVYNAVVTDNFGSIKKLKCIKY